MSILLRKAMYGLQCLRPMVRVLMPMSWQLRFSGWVYSSHYGPMSWVRKAFGYRSRIGDIFETVLHRLYWLTNPRGE